MQSWEGLEAEKDSGETFQDTGLLEGLDLTGFGASNEAGMDILQFFNNDFVNGPELPLPDITTSPTDLLPVKEEPGSPGGSSDLDNSSPSSPTTDDCSSDSAATFEFGGDYDNLGLKLNFPLGTFDPAPSDGTSFTGLIKEETAGLSSLDIKCDASFAQNIIDTYSAATNGGKRPREDTTLSGEQLRKLSSGNPNGNANASSVGTNGETRKTPMNLTPDEERQMKRQRRLIKNRESAQKSRLRKKLYIEELESKVNTLTTQSERLMQENAKLREDLSSITKFIRGLKPGAVIDVDANSAVAALASHQGTANHIQTSSPNVSTLSSSSSSSMQQQHSMATQHVRRVTGVAPKNVKAAGICLLIVLFSFGLFFNAKHGPNGPALPYEPSGNSLADATFGRRIGNRYAGKMLKAFREAGSGSGTMVSDVSDLSETYPTKRGLPELASSASSDTGRSDEDQVSTLGMHKKRRTTGLPAITALPMVPDKEKEKPSLQQQRHVMIDASYETDTDTDTDDDDNNSDDYVEIDISPVSSPMTDIETMTSLNEKNRRIVDVVDVGDEPANNKMVEEVEEESGTVVSSPSPNARSAPISMLMSKDALCNETLATVRGGGGNGAAEHGGNAVHTANESNDVDPPMIEVSSQLRNSAVSVS